MSLPINTIQYLKVEKLQHVHLFPYSRCILGSYVAITKNNKLKSSDIGEVTRDILTNELAMYV